MEISYTIIASDGKQYGPITLEQLKAWITEGRVVPSTQILRSDINAWHAASEYVELGLAQAATAVVATTPYAPQYSPAVQIDPDIDKHIANGASYFYWIAILSVVNSVIALSGGHMRFIFGLGITQIIDALGGGVAMALDLLVAGVLVGFGIFARKRHAWVFILGMILYALDALLFLLVQDILPIIVHAYVLFRLFLGLKGCFDFSSAQKAARPVGTLAPR